ncbi:phage portal protein, partial [Chloroflexota bacterium]
MGEGFNPAELNRRDVDRLKGYRELLDFYHGVHWEGRERRGEKRLTFNYAKVFIDKVTSYLMSGTSFVVEASEGSDEAGDRVQKAEAALYQVYEDNNLEQLDFETEVDCAILGDACYKVIWDQEAKSVRITAPDIQGIYAWWVGDNTTNVWRVASKYSLTADMVESLYEVRAKDKTASIIEVWTAQDFELWIDGAQVERKPNPYGFIPFVIYPNLREPKKFWGISDLSQIIEPQRELNRATSQLSKILELSGNPVAVLENVEESADQRRKSAMSLRKGVLKSFNSGNYTTTVQIASSYKVYLEDISVARNLPSAEMVDGRKVAVIFLD